MKKLLIGILVLVVIVIAAAVAAIGWVIPVKSWISSSISTPVKKPIAFSPLMTGISLFLMSVRPTRPASFVSIAHPVSLHLMILLNCFRPTATPGRAISVSGLKEMSLISSTNRGIR